MMARRAILPSPRGEDLGFAAARCSSFFLHPPTNVRMASEQSKQRSLAAERDEKGFREEERGSLARVRACGGPTGGAMQPSSPALSEDPKPSSGRGLREKVAGEHPRNLCRLPQANYRWRHPNLRHPRWLAQLRWAQHLLQG